MDKIRTRFAPSPTGYLHVGSLRAALFEYAYAKTYGGDFILRIEDTDRKRFVAGATENLIETLHTFGINWDEGPEVGGKYEPYIQSERVKMGIYKKAAEKLVEEGHAYYCFCETISKEEIQGNREGEGVVLRDPCRDIPAAEAKKKIENGETGAIRLKVPDEGEISYHDFVLNKDISWQLKDVDEAMLLKSDGFPTYHLAVVIDDALMKINPILRGFEWLPSTPIHLLIYKHLGEIPPKIGHFSLILDPEGGKLSKRKGNVSCEAFLADGYLPEALLNFIMLLGWSPKDNREFFLLEDYVKEFKNGNLQIANGVFDRKKLDWFNGEYIRKLKIDELNSRFRIQDSRFLALSKDKQDAITKLVRDRIVKLSDFNSLAGFFFAAPEVDVKLFGKGYKKHLTGAYGVISSLKDWNLDSLNSSLLTMIKEKNYKTGDFFMDLRIAICGSRFTPPINDSIIILGKEETLIRLRRLVVNG